ncbi:hypothetical protein [Cupriavidus pauculus]|uniref:hypothetical protein n=1 Tax=Cupriavidus pauculus TaxID=82633 RepID=UPI003857D417
MDDKIKELQAQVAALQHFAIALIDALPTDSAGSAGSEFRSLVLSTLRDLSNAGYRDEANRFQEAVDDINSRSPSYPGLPRY